MFQLRKYIVPVLLVFSLSVLAGADVECDFEDGEFEWDFPSFHHHDDHYDYYYEEEFYYDSDPWGWFW